MSTILGGISMNQSYIAKVLRKCISVENEVMFVFENIENNTRETLTGNSLSNNIIKMGSMLQHKFNRSEKVLILLPQGLEFIYSVMGCWYANVTAVLTPFTGISLKEKDVRKIELIISDSRPKAIITSRENFETLQAQSFFAGITLIDINEYNNLNYQVLPQNQQKSNDLALLTYTSGSTSKPKGVMLTHYDILYQAEAKEWRIDSDTRMVSWLPQFHAFGINNNILVPAINGGVSVIFSPESFVRDPKRWLQLISKYQATHTACLNFSFDYCVENIDEDLLELSLKSLKVITCAGEPIREKSYLNFQEKFKRIGLSENIFCPLYGLTEICPITSIAPGETVTFLNLDIESLKSGRIKIIDNNNGKKVTSCGRIDENIKVIIVNSETEKLCSANEVGEIWISSNRVASGYYNNPEETEIIFNGVVNGIADLKFFRTNDLGFIEKNELYIIGREKEMMIINGKNFHPVDIEWMIQNEIPIVSSVAVFSTDILDKERVITVVELKNQEDVSLTCEKIIGAISKNYGLEIYDLLIVEKGIIPKTGSGKIQRSVCKNNYLDEKLDIFYRYQNRNIKHRTRNNEERKIVDEIRTELINLNLGIDNDTLMIADEIGDLGLSSIQYTQIASTLEQRFDIRIKTIDLFKYPTFQKLAHFIQQQLSNLYKEYAGESNKSLRSENESADEENENNLIAIIGMDFYFPGQANTKEKLWSNLLKGVDTVASIASKRTSIIRDFKTNHGDGKLKLPKWGSFIDQVEQFDSDFFKISPVEVECMDPQQRKALQMTWKTLEDGGYNPVDFSGNKVGVFIGAHNVDYEELLLKNTENLEKYGAYVDSGTHLSLIANRVSRWFDFKGPSETINTACSSSLVSIHRAIQSIKNKECTIAIAGGINLIVAPKVYLACEVAGMLSRDGKCKTFDEQADGFVRAEGYGAVMLKPYKQAKIDNDGIYGIIRGSNVNHDGKTSSLRAPSIDSQTELIKEAYLNSDTPLETVNYIEMHGTGTKLGDPIEFEALKNVFGHNKQIALGALKTNIGHLESAAGIGGLIKVLLSLKYKTLPKIIHFNSLNPNISIEGTKFSIVKENRPWEQVFSNKGEPLPRRAGISSFGFGGSNAHVIVEEHVNKKQLNQNARSDKLIFPLSAKNKESLLRMVSEMYKYLDSEDFDDHFSMENLAYTLQIGRKSFEQRHVFLADNLAELKIKLYNYLENIKGFSEFSQDFTDDKTCDRIDISGLNSEEIAEKWMKSGFVKWETLYNEKEPARLHLPTYQFSLTNYWLSAKPEIEEELDQESALHTKATHYLKQLFSELSMISIEKIDERKKWDSYRIDSLIIKKMTDRMKGIFIGLSVSTLFEYSTISDLATYLVESYSETLENNFELNGATQYEEGK